ncbi:MAG: nucleoside-triphosphatase [Gemmatimonadales bacterium]
MNPPNRVLLTGPPGCGKTTAIIETLKLVSVPAVGFYTEEVRTAAPGQGRRVGFDVVALEGRRGPLARLGAPGPRVGRYGVDVPSFESIALGALQEALRDPGKLVVLDELGKMEFQSERFVRLLSRLFQAPNPILGAVLARPHPVAERFRHMPGIDVITVTQANRAELPGRLALLFNA